MIVSDIVADVAFFLDYGTLVIFKSSNSAFLKLTSKLEGRLARCLDYALHLDEDVVLTLVDSGKRTFFEETRQSSKEVFVEFIRCVSSIVGPHRIRQLYHGRPDLIPLEEVAALVPGAKLVEQLYTCGKQDWDMTYLGSLPCLKDIISSGATVPNIHTLLGGDLALSLRYIYLGNWRSSRDIDTTLLENDIIRICSSASDQPTNEERILAIQGMQFSLEFIARIASVISSMDQTVTVVLSYAADHDIRWQRNPYTADTHIALAHWTEYAEFTNMPLDSAAFEEKCVALPPQARLPMTVNGATWIKTAYFSRTSNTAVFVHRYDVIATNNPDHVAQECHQHDPDYLLQF